MHYAHLILSAKLPLAETADILGKVLGVKFAPETTGRYEEFPAFVASGVGVSYALLGIPEPGQDVREEPDDTYCLDISSSDAAASKNIQALVVGDLRIEVVSC